MIDKIKAEIERLKKKDDSDDYSYGFNIALDRALSFIESLEKEQEPVDLVAELKHHLATTPKEQLQKEWDELEEWGNIGPTVNEFLYGKDESAPKIKGWVARDKDGSLTFFSVRPIKFEEYAERWYVPGACTTCYLGFRDDYKDLTWEDDPIEVELEIHRV